MRRGMESGHPGPTHEAVVAAARSAAVLYYVLTATLWELNMTERFASDNILLDYDDVRALPDDGRRYEVLAGDLFVSPSPIPVHQTVILNLTTMLHHHVRKHRLGWVFFAPLDVLLSDHDIVQPDLIFVSRARRSIIKDKNIKGIPNLLIEILSPSLGRRDTRDKRRIYAQCRVPFYWILDPARKTLLELRLETDRYAAEANLRGGAPFKPLLFPRLTIPLSEVWP